MLVWLIKSLSKAAQSLKEYAVQREVEKLHQAAFDYDAAAELATKRVEFAEALAAKLIGRAYEKQDSDEKRANEKRSAAAQSLELLESL